MLPQLAVGQNFTFTVHIATVKTFAGTDTQASCTASGHVHAQYSTIAESRYKESGAPTHRRLHQCRDSLLKMGHTCCHLMLQLRHRPAKPNGQSTSCSCSGCCSCGFRAPAVLACVRLPKPQWNSYLHDPPTASTTGWCKQLCRQQRLRQAAAGCGILSLGQQRVRCATGNCRLS